MVIVSIPFIGKGTPRQWSVFVLTFFGYASYHACRQSFADAKESMQKNHNWEGFSEDFEGLMDAVFLTVYAIGLFNGGVMGDKFDAASVFSFGLIVMSLIYVIFGCCIPYFDFDNRYFFIGLWVFNGAIQSLGWPTGIKLMANWFDGAHDGAIFGLWAANQCLGNIMGQAYDAYVSAKNWPLQWNFFLPAMQAMVMSFLVFFFVPTYPPGCSPSDRHRNQQNRRLSMSQESNERYGPIEPAANNANVSESVSLLKAFKLPNVLTYGLTYACLKGVNYTLFFWLPYFLSSSFSKADADLLSMGYNLGQILGGWVCGWISDKFAKRTPTMMIFLILSVTPLFMLHISTDSVVFVATLSTLAGFFVGGPSNIISSVMAAEVGKLEALKGNPASLATVSGIIDGTGSVGAAICVYVSGRIPTGTVFILLACLIVAAGIMLGPLTYKDIKFMIRRKHMQSMSQQSNIMDRDINEGQNNEGNVNNMHDDDPTMSVNRGSLVKGAPSNYDPSISSAQYRNMRDNSKSDY